MASRGRKPLNYSKVCDTSSVDAAIAEIAGRQKGLIATRQLRRLGLNEAAIHYRVRIGRLHCLERGVYAVGYRSTDPDAPWMAALLHAGPEAILSHRTAAAHWALRRSSSPRVEITSPHRHRPRPRTRFHRGSLPADERTVHEGLAVTTVPRTLLDLAAVLAEGELEVAVGEAEAMRLTDPLGLPELIARYPRRRGIGRLRRVLDRLDGGGTLLRSELERRFLALLADAGLPRPRTNVPVEAGGAVYECDCVWPAARLIVELDGRGTHARRAAMGSDRLRDRRLATAGWTVVRITWEQLRDQPDAVLADLRSLIYTHPPAPA